MNWNTVLAGVALIALAVVVLAVAYLRASWTRAVIVVLGWVLVIVGVWLLGRGL